MKSKPVLLRGQAGQDIQNVIEYYRSEGAEKTGLAFIDALQQAFTRIAHHPAIGSPHYGHQLDLAGLRHWPVKRFPYLVFYLELDEHVDVWRVLHAESDIPAWMR